MLLSSRIYLNSHFLLLDEIAKIINYFIAIKNLLIEWQFNKMKI